MSNPRVYFAMAEDSVLPPVFMKVNSKTQVQEFGLTLFCFFILITLFFTSEFQEILNYVMFFDSIGFITAAAAIFILRYRAKKSGDPDGIFKMRGYPYLPIFFIIAYTAVSIAALMADPDIALWGVSLFLSGLPLFYLIRYLVKKAQRNH
jgi:APA family basic amino acid/polyamine antiporter